MAGFKRSTGKDGIRRESSPHSDWFRGPREQLIAQGLVPAEWFPDPSEQLGRGRSGRVKRRFCFTTSEGQSVIVRDCWNDLPGVWSVHVCTSELERARRERAAQASAPAAPKPRRRAHLRLVVDNTCSAAE